MIHIHSRFFVKLVVCPVLEDISSREDDTYDNENHRPFGQTGSNSSIVAGLVGVINDRRNDRCDGGG